MDIIDFFNIFNYIGNYESRERMFLSFMFVVIFYLRFLEYNIMYFIMLEKMELSELSDLEIEIFFIKIFVGFFLFVEVICL